MIGMTKNKEKVLTRLFMGVLFVSFLIFFTRVHPIVLFDTDDWCYAYCHRDALPLWGVWNPIRVFPEVFMPLVSLLGRYCFELVFKDYLFSLTFSYALAVSSIFMIMVYHLYIRFKEKTISIFLVSFFIICHFWIFRVSAEGNDYMFATIDACTYFYYVIPNFLNCILVLWMIKKMDGGRESITPGYIEKSVYVFLVYFCIFSNLWAGIIIASYTGSVLLIDLAVKLKYKKFQVIPYCKRHVTEFIIMTLWSVSQVFELKGGRAKSIMVSGPYLESVKSTLKTLKQTLGNINHGFFFSAAVIVLAGGVVMIRNKRSQSLKLIAHMYTSFFIMAAYLVLSCAKAGSWYLGRPDVFYGCFFFGMIVVVYCAYEIVVHIPKLQSFIPLFLLIALVNCNTEGKTYRESTIRQISPKICMDISNDIVNQFLNAEENGKREIKIYVPFFDAPSNDNWPLATYANTALSDHVYKMGIVKEKIMVTEIVPSKEKNLELHVN